MSRYAELLNEAKAAIEQIDLPTLFEQLQTALPPLVIDVREADEWMRGHIPGAKHIPGAQLAANIQSVVPDPAQPLVTFCARGARAAFAALELQSLGYKNVKAATAGFVEWRAQGHPVHTPEALSASEVDRYARHLRLPEVGVEGQQRLLGARVLVVGAGGLGSPALQYLAAAGVGTIGIIDDDVVDASNLQRQVIHSMSDLDRPKVLSARDFIERLNPQVNVLALEERLTQDNVREVLERGWDVIVDGLDNLNGRYLLNDEAARQKIPLVHGSVHRFVGQVTTLCLPDGPCYRCLHPLAPDPEMMPSCEEAGVFGVLPGVIGVLQATETLKLVLQAGDTLQGRVLHYDALSMNFRTLTLRKRPDCQSCGAFE